MDGGWQAEGKGCLETGAVIGSGAAVGLFRSNGIYVMLLLLVLYFIFCEKTLGNLPSFA